MLSQRGVLARSVEIALVSCALLGVAGRASATVTMPMVPVGNPGNVSDGTTGYGSVGYSYNIGKYDVTASQYTAFLNAVAATDTYSLYSPFMATDTSYGCGISQTGTAGHYLYATTKNPNFPVNYVSWGDAARFSNWLSNNQPTGNEGNGTTETGSYTLNGATTDAALMLITRNSNSNYVIPTEDEWYKAAYYKGGGLNTGYWLYPTGSNTQPSNTLSPTGTDNANYNNNGYTDPTNYLTAVGYFAASPSAYGTFDQGGDVYQWNEANVFGSSRGLRGGAFFSYDGPLLSGYRTNYSPTYEVYDIGFRVAQVPEPASLALLALGGVGVALRRRPRHQRV